jgi:predicted secreted hydrolase
MAEQNFWQDWQKTVEDFVKPFEKTAADLLETAAETFVGKAEPLRDGTEHDPLELPRDLYAHEHAQTEWWYYTGHFATDSGKHYGFELVFFKRRTDLDKFGVVPLRLFGNPIYFAHFALTDIDKSFATITTNRRTVCSNLPHPQAKNIFTSGSAIGLCARRTARTFSALRLTTRFLK